MEARLTGSAAERIFALKVEKYCSLNAQQLNEMKWLFLLQHYQLKLLIKKSTAVRRSLIALVVDLKQLSLEEIAQGMLVF